MIALLAALQITAGQLDVENKVFSLSEKVFVETATHGTLTAQKGCFDAETNRATLYDRVAYEEPKLSFTCEQVETVLEGPLAIEAHGNLRIFYNDVLTVLADDGYYGDDFFQVKSAAGCRVSHERGDTMSASTITLRPKEQLIEADDVLFRDHFGEIEAKHVTVAYDKGKPLTVEAVGEVRIKNFAATNHIASDTCLHYILADRALLDLTTETLRLSSTNGRTLVFDKINNIQVSAPAVTVKRDPKTKKEQIKGEGDVRFSFSEKELNLFKQRFKMIQNAK